MRLCAAAAAAAAAGTEVERNALMAGITCKLELSSQFDVLACAVHVWFWPHSTRLAQQYRVYFKEFLQLHNPHPVSYTHLTLPTIYSV